MEPGGQPNTAVDVEVRGPLGRAIRPPLQSAAMAWEGLGLRRRCAVVPRDDPPSHEGGGLYQVRCWVPEAPDHSSQLLERGPRAHRAGAGGSAFHGAAAWTGALPSTWCE